MGVDDSAAVRTTGWRRHVDDLIPLGRLWTEPAGMSPRSAPLLPVRRRRSRRFVQLVFCRTILAKPPLPFGLQFPLTLVQLLPESLILFEQRGSGLALRVELPVEHRHDVVLFAGGQNQAAQVGAPHV